MFLNVVRNCSKKSSPLTLCDSRTSFHLILYKIVEGHLVLNDIVEGHIVLYNIAEERLVLYDIGGGHLVLYDTAEGRFVLYNIAERYRLLYNSAEGRIVLYDIAKGCLVLRKDAYYFKTCTKLLDGTLAQNLYDVAFTYSLLKPFPTLLKEHLVQYC